MTADRRTSTRRKVSLASELETDEGRKAIGVCRDASDRGILLLTQVALTLGSKFRLHIVRPTGAPPVSIAGRVVRCEPLELDLADVWSYRVGVELIDPPAELAALLDELTAHAAG